MNQQKLYKMVLAILIGTVIAHGIGNSGKGSNPHLQTVEENTKC
jgi:hypothetical protein